MNGHIHILALHGVDLPCVVQLFILIHALILRMLFHCASWTQRPAPGCIQRGEQQLLASTINSSVTFGFPNIKAILCTWSKRSKKGTCCQVQCFLTETLSWIDSFDSFDSCFRVVYGQTQILWAWVSWILNAGHTCQWSARACGLDSLSHWLWLTLGTRCVKILKLLFPALKWRTCKLARFLS